MGAAKLILAKNVKSFKPFAAWFLVAVLAFFHLVTLNRSPLTEYDEVFFHNVTQQWMETGSYLLSIRPNLYPFEISFYGPVYFELQTFMLQLLGNGIWEFRLLNALCGIAILALVYRLTRKLAVPKTYIFAGILFLLLDPTYTEILHSGRMDFVALLLAMAAVVVIQQKQANRIQLLLGCLLGSLALMTTPRAIFLVPWILWVAHRGRRLGGVHGIGVLLVFAPWVLWIFGKVGIMQYWAMMTHPIIACHIGADLSIQKSLFRHAYQSPLVLLWLLSLLYEVIRAFKGKRSEHASPWGLHASTLVFLMLVAERASYTAMVMPLMLIAILATFAPWIKASQPSRPHSRWVPLFQGLGTLQLSIVAVLWCIQVWGEIQHWDERSEYAFSMPTVDSKTIYSEPKYYYAILAAGKTFRFADDPTETIPADATVLRNKPLQYGDWRDHFSVFTQTYNPVWEQVD